MARAVTADHVLFDECINAFRPMQENRSLFSNGESFSYIMTAFELNNQWNLEICNLSPIRKISLPGAYSAFIGRVNNPNWVGTHNSHLFGIALSSIISFVTGKICKSTRDDYLCRKIQLSDEDFYQLALVNPILIAGPGCTHAQLTLERQNILKEEICKLIEKLNKIDYKIYRIIMQSIRLIHLSLLNKRDDFGLAYLLVVSAIEAIAQEAIKRDKVKRKYPSEKQWNKRAEVDEEFSDLLKLYKDARGKNQYLTERYVKFVLDYAPTKNWEDYVSHPMQEISEYIMKNNPTHNTDQLTQKSWFEKYPNELEESQIKEILSESYNHRSCFIHRGEQPPHSNPLSYNRFFQEHREYKEHETIEKLLPNYELLLGIAKYSIIGWLNSK